MKTMNSVRMMLVLIAVAVPASDVASAQMVKPRPKSDRTYERAPAPPEKQVEPRRKLPPGAVEEGPVSRTSVGDVAAVSAVFDDVQAVPRHDGVAIRFWSVDSTTATVEIGKGRPRQVGSRWIFRDGQSAGQGAAVGPRGTGPLSRKVGVVANTPYRFDSSEANLRPLDQGETYHFIVTVPRRDGAGELQTIGSFTTMIRSAKVVFEKVKVISDGDPDPPPPIPADCGEIDFLLWANYGQPTGKFVTITKDRLAQLGKVCTDHFYNIGRTLEVDHAPDILILSVSGRDQDNEKDYAGSDVLGPAEPAPFNAPRDSGDEEQNVAIGEFDLRRYETGTNIPFKLLSMPAGGGSQGDLMFEVYGYIRIIYWNK